MQPIKKSLEDFLSERGVGTPFSDYMIDKMKIPHGLSQRQKKKLEREAMNANTEYSKKRQDAVVEYNRLVEQGEMFRKLVPKELFALQNTGIRTMLQPKRHGECVKNEGLIGGLKRQSR